MNKLLSILVLSVLAGTSTLAQQSSPPPPKAATRVLTPAEQKQKDKIDREIQRDRQIRAEWAQKQREYEAKQAEKERQKQAKKMAKDREQQARDVPTQKPLPATPPVVTVPPVNQPSTAEPVPVIAEPTRKEKREKRKQEKAAQMARVPIAPSVPVIVPETPPSVPAEKAKPEPVNEVPKLEPEKREKQPKSEPADSVFTVPAVSEPAMSRARHEFLPKGHLFEPILLDPLESQTYGSVFPVYITEGKRYNGSIVPFAFGFAKPFYRRTAEAGRAEEWVLDLASFTQFEAYHDATLNKALRRIINTDYKISIIYNIRRGVNAYRFRVYHLSSHLGDDYIFRNKITLPTPNSVNYELLDLTYSRMIQAWRLYGGIGFVLRKPEERKLLSGQLGLYYKKLSDRGARLVGGVDVKVWQQTDFRPGIHGGIGIEVGRTQNNLTFLLEGYSGFRPYSQFENQQTSWIGLGLYLNPF
ncbi:MAG: hypothetical protein JWP57_2436 [Spirosoma sp.]|nr:hypothetical protein [Spirosoma sp.]